MRNLQEIRVAVQKRPPRPNKPPTPHQTSGLTTIREQAETKADRLQRDVAKVVTVTVAGQEKRVSVSKRKLQKDAAQVAEVKRQEIAKLQVEIDRLKQEARSAGGFVVEEARKQADVIVKQATDERKAVRGLRDSLEHQLEAVRQAATEQEASKEAFSVAQARLRALQEATGRDKEQVAKEKSDLRVAKEQAEELLVYLVALLQIAVDRTQAIGGIEEEQKSRVAEAMATAGRAIRLLAERKRNLEVKEEHLVRRGKQLDSKWDIIKDQRVQLKMAQDELRKK